MAARNSCVVVVDGKFNKEITADAKVIYAPELRSPEVRECAFALLDELFAFVHEVPRLQPLFRHVDLLESIRLAVAYQILPAAQSWLCWQRVADAGISTVDVLANPARLNTLLSDARAMGMRATARDVAAWGSWVSLASWARRCRQSWQASLVRWREKRIARQQPSLPPADRTLPYTPVLFANDVPTSVPILIPIYEHLRDNPRYRLLWLSGRRQVYEELQRNNIPACNLLQLPTIHPADVSKADWDAAIDDFVEHRQSASANRSPPSLTLALKSAFREIRDAHQLADKLTHLFDEFQPQACITTAPQWTGARIIELLSKKVEATSIHVQHGMFDPSPDTRYMLADFVCVWGEVHRDVILQNPCQGSVIVTGSPKHARILQRLADVEADEPPLLVYFSSRYDGRLQSKETFDCVLDMVLAAASSFPQCEFVIKMHPGDANTTVEKIVQTARRCANVRVTQSDDTYQLLKRARLVFITTSTIGYEAVLFDRQVLLINPSGAPDPLPLVDLHCAIRVESEASLITIIREQLSCRSAAISGRNQLWQTATDPLAEIINRLPRA